MATLSRGLRVALTRDALPLRPSTRALTLASSSRQPIATTVRPISVSSFSQLSKPNTKLPSRTLTTLSQTNPKSTKPSIKAFTTTSPSRASAPTSSSTTSAQSPPASAYVEEGPELLPPHQPRIVVGDPARGRWTLSGFHAYVMAFILHFVVFGFLAIDFINDLYSYLGIVVSEQLGR